MMTTRIVWRASMSRKTTTATTGMTTATMTGVKTPMIAALVAALFAGCTSVPPDTFEIASPANLAVQSGSSAQLLIPEPTAIKTLDNDKIVVKTSPYSIEYLAQSQWSDRLPRMVQLRLLQAFENTGRIGAVGLPGQGLAIDYQLITEIRRFEIDTSGPATAQIDISVKALNDRNGTVRQSKIFSASAPVGAAGNNAYVAALNRAFDQISGEIVEHELINDPIKSPGIEVDGNKPIDLSGSVERYLSEYFSSFGEDLPPPGLHGRILREVEYPLIAAALAATRGNQVKAADLLGVNRNTLRKKIRDLDISVVRSIR